MNSDAALFLDRDGVINHDYGYVHLRHDFKFTDGIFELTSHATKRSYKIVVVTNQAGIGKGFYSEEAFIELNEWMCDTFARNGINISQVYYCASHPDGIGKYRKVDFRRKPNPGMLLEARNEFNLDLSKSFFIGDQKTDMEAGFAAGIGCNILFDPSRENFEAYGANYLRVSSLIDVIPLI